MINRNDLAKQFELVVQQEIINHNNAVLQTNLEINAIKQALDILENLQNKKISSLESTNVFFSHELEGLKCHLEKTLFSMQSALNDLSAKTANSISILLSELEKLKKSSTPRDVYKEDIQEVRNSILDLRNQFSLFDKSVDFKLNLQYSNFNERLEKHKKEIAAEPSVIKELRRELNTRINTSNVDITGIYEELQLQKKKQFVLEKECERLKTQLERIKKEL